MVEKSEGVSISPSFLQYDSVMFTKESINKASHFDGT